MTESGREPWLDGIDGDALPRLISGQARIIRVVAGPGSGKTTGLKRRVQRLIQGENVRPEQIFVGTFTRAIAGELAEALGVTVARDDDGDEPKAVSVSTLHSHALRLIRKHPTARPGREMRFLLSYEKDAMLYDIGEALSDSMDQNARKRELKRVCAQWAKGTDLDTAGFVGEMERWLRHHRGMLIDEVVNLARIGLESGEIPSGEFDHVVIDEYQDLTAAEQRLVELIWSKDGSLVVLGDDDQSIYSFRHNHPGGISEFLERWVAEEPADLSIPENRRCGRVIVEIGNAMMAAAGSAKPPMISRRGEEGEVAFVYWPPLAHEVGGLAKYMQARKDTRFLVLVPRRFIGYLLKRALGADAVTAFHEEALEVPAVQERFALAALVANPEDRIALRTVLGFCAGGSLWASKRNACAYRSLQAVPLVGRALLEAIAAGDAKLRGGGSKHVQDRAQHARDLLAGMPEDTEKRIEILFDPAVAAPIADPEVRDEARRDLEELRHSAHEIRQRLNQPTLAKVLERLRYRIAMRLPLAESEESRVRIMTLHGAKGLEADVVVIAGAADQIIPGFPPNEPAGEARHREEQRRLLYVSVTRAKRELVVSWPLSIEYKDAIKNQVRRDGGVRTQARKKVVDLGASRLVPDAQTRPQTGASWLKRKLAPTSS